MIDKKLLIFPLIAGFSILLLIAFIIFAALVGALLVHPDFFEGFDKMWMQNILIIDSLPKLAVQAPIHFIYLAIAYFCFVVFLFELLQSLRQQPVAIRRGLRFAAGRLPLILVWSLIMTTVWLTLDFIQRTCGIPGLVAGKLLTLAWMATCCFDDVCLAAEPLIKTPAGIIRRSLATFQKCWGKVLLGVAGFIVLYAAIVVLYGILLTVCTLAASLIVILVWPGLLLLITGAVALTGAAILLIALFETYLTILYVSVHQPHGDVTPSDFAPETAVITEE